MVEGVNRCKECQTRNVSCDGNGIPIDNIRRIGEEKRRLEREEEAAEQQLQELMGRLIRLRRLKRSLHEKGVRMIQRGLQNVDELEEQECLEQEGESVLVEQAAIAAEIVASEASLASFSGVGFDSGPLSPSTEAFLTSVGQGSGDGNRQASASRSGGAQ
ncbi:hypothetical protein F5Y02DRAFT_424676 [Annulohypoxylon stygium]|nr:hypothetical protein F5Y02DRAFT_424676 [Annulohypoxylon stygium]